MEPVSCRVCGGMRFVKWGEVVPEILEWRCASCQAPSYWHLREARESSLQEIKQIEREFHNNA